MSKLSRRNVLRSGVALAIPPGMVSLLAGCKEADTDVSQPAEAKTDDTVKTTPASESQAEGDSMKVHYLEIVTSDVEALCVQYSKIHGITFGEPDAALGGARTAKVEGGGLIGIRGPLRGNESPVIRPYTLVKDLKEAVANRRGTSSGAVFMNNLATIGTYGQVDRISLATTFGHQAYKPRTLWLSHTDVQTTELPRIESSTRWK